jgi:hypothetical protein
MVLAAAVFFAGMGLLALVRPLAVVAIFRIQLEHSDARSEVRAVYGGFGIAVAAVLVAGAGRKDAFGDGLVAATAIGLAGMAGGRLIGLLADRPRHAYPTGAFVVVEAGLALGLALTL